MLRFELHAFILTRHGAAAGPGAEPQATLLLVLHGNHTGEQRVTRLELAKTRLSEDGTAADPGLASRYRDRISRRDDLEDAVGDRDQLDAGVADCGDRSEDATIDHQVANRPIDGEVRRNERLAVCGELRRYPVPCAGIERACRQSDLIEAAGENDVCAADEEPIKQQGAAQPVDYAPGKCPLRRICEPHKRSLLIGCLQDQTVGANDRVIRAPL